MAILFALEDFAAPAAPPPDPQHPEELPGYAEGHAAAMAEVEASQALLAQEVVQAISDVTFGFAEARLHVMAGLEPMFRILIDTVLPAALPASFRAHLVARLVADARTDVSRPFALALNPAQIDAVSAILPPTLVPLLTLTPDPGLSAHTAAIRQGSLETALDHDALLADITQALSALFDHITESKAHG